MRRITSTDYLPAVIAHCEFLSWFLLPVERDYFFSMFFVTIFFFFNLAYVPDLKKRFDVVK